MRTVDQVTKILAEQPAIGQYPEDLKSLQDFFQRMKAAGIAKTREYDLPLPDTVGWPSMGRARKSR